MNDERGKFSEPLGIKSLKKWPTSLENPMDGGAWWPAVHGVAKSQTRLSHFTFTFHFHEIGRAHV